MLSHPRVSWNLVVRLLARGGCGLLPLLPVLAAAGSCAGGPPAGGTGGAGGGGQGGGGSSSITFSTGVTSPDAGCGDAAPAPSDGSTGCEGLDGGVSYLHDVVPIFLGCQGEGCHLSPTLGSTVGMAAYECCDGELLISPGNPNQSYLLDKIEGQDLCLGTRMPFGLPPLPASEILTIRTWICEGAPDN
jgi:hypothetical protein